MNERPGTGANGGGQGQCLQGQGAWEVCVGARMRVRMEGPVCALRQSLKKEGEAEVRGEGPPVCSIFQVPF